MKIEITITKEEIDVQKFWECVGGLSYLHEKTKQITMEQLEESGLEIYITLPQLYFRGIPFRFIPR